MPPGENHPSIGDIESALHAGAALGTVRAAAEDGTPFAIVPTGYEVRDLEDTLPRPRRLRARPTFAEVGSLVKYVERFKSADETISFADREKHTIAVVLDYHVFENPSHCEHVATFVARQSDQWKAWIGRDRVKLGQVDFAEFIEANIADVIEPSGASLLEVASNLEVNRSVRFKSGVRLHDGRTNLTFEETSGNVYGEVAIPPRITLAIPPFVGGDPYKVEARLRYRITDEGKAVLWYELVRPDVVIRHAFDALAKQFGDATAVEVLTGKHEA